MNTNRLQFQQLNILMILRNTLISVNSKIPAYLWRCLEFVLARQQSTNSTKKFLEFGLQNRFLKFVWAVHNGMTNSRQMACIWMPFSSAKISTCISWFEPNKGTISRLEMHVICSIWSLPACSRPCSGKVILGQTQLTGTYFVQSFIIAEAYIAIDAKYLSLDVWKIKHTMSFKGNGGMVVSNS